MNKITLDQALNQALKTAKTREQNTIDALIDLLWRDYPSKMRFAALARPQTEEEKHFDQLCFEQAQKND